MSPSEKALAAVMRWGVVLVAASVVLLLLAPAFLAARAVIAAPPSALTDAGRWAVEVATENPRLSTGMGAITSIVPALIYYVRKRRAGRAEDQ